MNLVDRESPEDLYLTTIRGPGLAKLMTVEGARAYRGEAAGVLTPARRLLLALAGVFFLIGAGTVGYIVIEDMSFLDAMYMSVITISTVGFREVKPLSPAGRVFTMILIVSGVGTALYLLAVAAELVVEGQLRAFLGASAMHRKLQQLENHVIVCGFGRFGRVVTEELMRHQVPVVVIDSDSRLEPELVKLGVLHVLASALDDDVLEEAGIKAARAVVVATGSDADNVYITLSAREKNPKISIHARGESDTGLRRLRSAGADQVISAYQRGGMRIAASILRPAVVDFLEVATPGLGEPVDLEEIGIHQRSHAVGKSIEEIERGTARLRVVALKRGEGPISIIPEAKTIVRAGDHLVAIGDREALKHLAEVLE